MIWGSISKTRYIFTNILCSTYWLMSIQKTITGTFVCLFTYKVTMIKVNFRLYKQCRQTKIHLACEWTIFLQNASISCFSSNICLYIEKNPVEKLCKVLEMELETYIPVSQNSFSRKSDLKFCIIFNMILFANAQGSLKIKLQPFTKFLRLTLVFMLNSTLRKKFNFCFSRVFY